MQQMEWGYIVPASYPLSFISRCQSLELPPSHVPLAHGISSLQTTRLARVLSLPQSHVALVQGSLHCRLPDSTVAEKSTPETLQHPLCALIEEKLLDKILRYVNKWRQSQARSLSKPTEALRQKL
ncbi:hypothetical protein PGT21_002543 [Puccinia graminis f. sp. tritici]|uniref:Uncharacterized protein n=1 Tax=Puccinia graminis f. sp. tritici TaxID=56615 RepID=A0A5B0QTE2_PUCGR|nr:hypothetical protein PGT21_002543 [Puccinia graminis f. sp. tritici]